MSNSPGSVAATGSSVVYPDVPKWGPPSGSPVSLDAAGNLALAPMERTAVEAMSDPVVSEAVPAITVSSSGTDTPQRTAKIVDLAARRPLPATPNLGQSTSVLTTSANDEVLTTAASATAHAAEKIASFHAALAMPETWGTLQKVLAPKYREAELYRNSFVETVRRDPVSKVLSLAFIPTTPFALYALTAMAKSDYPKAEISATQHKFLREIFEDGSLSAFVERAKQALPLMSGLSPETLRQEAQSGSPQSLSIAFTERLMGYSEEHISAEHLDSARAKLNEIQAFLGGDRSTVLSKLDSGEIPDGMQVLLRVVSGGRSMLGAEYKANRVDPLITKFVPEETARGMGQTLGGLAGRLSSVFKGHAEKVQGTVVQAAEQLTNDKERVITGAAEKLLGHLSSAAADTKTREAVGEAHRSISGILGDLFKAVSAKAATAAGSMASPTAAPEPAKA